MIQLKLAKRIFQPCLVVETRTLEVDVVRDVPITVRRRETIIIISILLLFHIIIHQGGVPFYRYSVVVVVAAIGVIMLLKIPLTSCHGSFLT